MKKLFVASILMLLLSFAEAQDFAPWSKDVNASAVEVDRLGNIYLLKDNVVAKYDADMNFVCAYDNYPAGSMSSLDVSNPFKVIVLLGVRRTEFVRAEGDGKPRSVAAGNQHIR